MDEFRREGFGSDLSKTEFVMILNLRPSDIPLLSTIIDKVDSRFTLEEQTKILELIERVLGTNPGPPPEQVEDAE